MNIMGCEVVESNMYIRARRISRAIRLCARPYACALLPDRGVATNQDLFPPNLRHTTTVAVSTLNSMRIQSGLEDEQ